MYAIIETGGKQYRVTTGDVLDLERLEAPETGPITFDRVLMIEDTDGPQIGAPTVAGATVSAELIEQHRGVKVVVVKFRRRKGYHRRQGHRQSLTKVRITAINHGA